MFTGLVEEVGTLLDRQVSSEKGVLRIKACKVLKDSNIGDSISTNGVCLTVTHIEDDFFTADVMPKTLDLSNLGKIPLGSKLNLERSLMANSRLGGHMVSGHVDTTGNITSIVEDSNAILYTIDISDHDSLLVIERGSISIDGISLTVSKLSGNFITVSVIPHTRSHTNLCDKAIGSMVNIEYDIFGKYLKNYMVRTNRADSNIDMDFLMTNNFL